MKKDNIVKDKSTDFAVRIINLVKHQTKNMPYTEHAICTQLLKSGTSIGANIREAEHAESREDFIHKLKIALKYGADAVYIGGNLLQLRARSAEFTEEGIASAAKRAHSLVELWLPLGA